jgi:hypothetical protein
MLISEVLDPFRATGFLEQDRLNRSLWAALTNAEKTQPGWGILTALLTLDGPRSSVNPNEIERLCAELNVTTFEQVSAIAGAAPAGFVSGIHKLIRPSFAPDTVGFRRSIAHWELKRAIFDNFHILPPDIDLITTDGEMPLLTLDEIKRFAQICPSRRYGYVTELLDCDDFSIIAKGYASECGIGAYSMASAHVVCCDAADKELGRHALNAFLYDDNGQTKGVYFEPQSNTLIEPKVNSAFGLIDGAAWYRIIKVIF